MNPPTSSPPTRLARRLGLGDAVVVGLGAMLGVGVFAGVGPASREAGSGLLVGLAIAAGVAYCNATSSAQLAALYPESGGTYVYGRRRLDACWGYIAGWTFIVGKVASCAAMALTFGAYAAPTYARLVAVAVVIAVVAIDYSGVRKTVLATRWIVGAVLVALAVVVVGALFGGSASPARLHDVADAGLPGILQSAGLLFVAFAGYARIATLGEEVVDPARTIPRAVPWAFAICLGVYGVVFASALLAAGPEVLARAEAPLVAAVQAGRFGALAGAVRVGGALAAAGVLLSLVAGVSRTVFAMAADSPRSRPLAAVHPRHGNPARAGLLVGVVVLALVASLDVRHALGVSAANVLAYYAITNAAALTLTAPERRWPRAYAAVGFVGCFVLAGAAASTLF